MSSVFRRLPAPPISMPSGRAEALNILHAERFKKTRRKVLEQILTRAALQRGATACSCRQCCT